MLIASCGHLTQPGGEPLGEDKHLETPVLEAGASALQRKAPVNQINMHLVGVHPMKDYPHHQIDSHHFCPQVNEDFARCVWYDSDSPVANLNGIEFIISERLFNGLPAEGRQYWHPHNYEILSGILVAPAIPELAEHRLMRDKINSYGKTWNVWNTGSGGHASDSLPLGEPKLGWALNHDGEADSGILEARQEELGYDMQAKREGRKDLIELARPQVGVEVLKD